MTGFCFHIQVWDWFSLEGKQRFGGQPEAEGQKGVHDLGLQRYRVLEERG